MFRLNPGAPDVSSGHPLNQRYLALAHDPSLWSAPLDTALQLIARSVSEAMAVTRVGVWCYSDDRKSITLRQLYDRDSDSFSHGIEIGQRDYPRYFEELHQARLIDITDFTTDPRTLELHASYAAPNHIGAMVDAPLRYGAQLWGVLCIEHVGGPRSWSTVELGFVTSIADLLSQLLSYDALRASEQRLRFLGDHLPIGIVRTDSEGRATYVNPYWCELTGCTPAQSLGRGWLEALAPEERTRVADDLLAALGGDAPSPHAHSDCRLDGDRARWLSYRWVPERDELGLPLGALGAFSDIGARRTAEEVLARSYQRVSWINRLSQELHQQRDLTSIAKTALAMLHERVPAPLLRFASREGDRLLQVAEHGELSGQLPAIRAPARLLPTFSTGEVIYLDVKTARDLPDKARAEALQLGLCNYIVLMLIDGDNLLGLLSIALRDPAMADRIEGEDLRAFASTLTLALANLHHLRELEYRAEHDSLTGLPNRSLLHRKLTQALDSGQPLALMLLDLDRFKEVNDALGHPIGDRLLCQIGPRLRETLGAQPHLLCRLGGDEFAVLLFNVEPGRAFETARDLQRAITRPFDIDGLALQVGTSIGIACSPVHSSDGHELLRAADVAMYSAKRNGLGVAGYDAELDTNSPERLALIAELNSAIGDGGLVLHYQPKIELGNHRVIGFEALVRWQHPRLGLLPPGAFMPFAEISDAIHALTYEVLRQSLQQQRRWLAAGLPAAIAINLSARNLMQGDFFERLQALLAESGADPTLLELEITETSLMHDPHGAAQLLRRIAALGVRLSIDDFGTGYSSLGYLKKLPIHALKIDRTFVHDMARSEADAIIVRSTIALAHNLNLQVVAEGVEDASTLAQLRDMGCDLAQGFHISRPQPVGVIESWLAQYN
jgi:diguanylate cyclase (GGDEF)-like protein/PAS domain S-box-containing protein